MKSIIPLVFYSVLAFIGVQAETPSAELLLKPQNVKVETISATSLRVTWEAPPKNEKNNETLHYYIGNKPLTDSYGIYMYDEIDNCPNKNCSFEINNLKENQQYAIIVGAFNSHGFGPWSDEVKQFTAEGKPVIPPGEVRCEALSPEEIRLSWKIPPLDSLHGILKGYKVTYAVSHLFDDEQNREYKTTLANETVLHGLKKNRVYAIRVSATTAGGDGPKSPRIHCATETDVPDKPIDVKVILKGAEKALVIWRPSLEESGYILSYTIYYQKNGSEPKTGKVLASKTRYEISGLEPNESYEFWVTASTKDGEGPASDYVTKITSKDIAPQIVTYGDRFTVKFKGIIGLPCDFAGSPTPNVMWKVNGDNLILDERMITSYAGELFIENVRREDANNYTCFVENEFGNDSITHELIVRAPPKSPEITILSTTTVEIILKVKPNSTDSAPINGYDLYYKLDSEIEEWKKVEIGVNCGPFKIEHCNCGSSYLIYAIGHNDLGDGDASETRTVRTNGSKPSAPEMNNFIEPSTESVTLYFGSWNENSCPISHFFVAFKKKQHNGWIDIRNKIKANTNFVLNLEPATCYDLRVTAHNVAGSTLAKYEVSTLPMHLATIAPPSDSDNDVPNTEKTSKEIKTNLGETVIRQLNP